MSRWISLWLTPPLSVEEERELNFEQLDLLHQNKILAAIIYSLNSLITISYLYMSGGDPVLLGGWLLFFQVLSLKLYINWRRHNNKPRPEKIPKNLLIKTFVSSLFGGASWGLFVISTFGDANAAGQLLMCIVVVGTAAGAISMLYSIPAAAAGYILCALVPPIILTSFIDIGDYIFADLVTGVFIFFLLVSMRNAYLALVKMVHLRVGFQELARSEQAANHAKSMFLANMSHELRTPLNAIIGFSQIIKNKMFGDIAVPQYENYVEDINKSGEHLLELVNEILDLSRIETGQVELERVALSLPDIIQSVIVMVREKAREKKIDFSTDVDTSLPPVFVDVKKIKQVLISLVINAIKFTPEGGEVIIYAFLNEKDEYIIQIKDSGTGIAEEDIEKVLNTFGQIDQLSVKEGQGAGLGLPVARAMTELHGGKLRLESSLNKGTLVTISLPHDCCRVPDIAPVSYETAPSEPLAEEPILAQSHFK